MSYETKDKMVSHPDHYQSGKYEVIDIIDEFTKDLSGTEAVCTANAIKYILRWKKKNGIQDINKAIWYLTHLVEHLEIKECQKEVLKFEVEEDKEREEHAEFDEYRFNKLTMPVDASRSSEGIDDEFVEKKNKFKSGDLVVIKNYTGTKIIYIYLNNNWVLRVPNYVLVRSECDYCFSNYIDKFIADKVASYMYNDLEYASREDITEHDSIAKDFYYPDTLNDWLSKLIGNIQININKEPEKKAEKLEPGCDKCEISECRFLKDPFMNPPYDQLWNDFKALEKKYQASMDYGECLRNINKELEEKNQKLWNICRRLTDDNKELEDENLQLKADLESEHWWDSYICGSCKHFNPDQGRCTFDMHFPEKDYWDDACKYFFAKPDMKVVVKQEESK